MKHSILGLATLAFLAACQDAGPPPTPDSFAAVSATTMPASIVGAAIGTAPTFQVLSVSGKVIRGVPVTVTVTSGGGTLANAPVKTRGGATSIGIWTLGPIAGPQTVSVTVSPFAPLVFTVNATPAGASLLQKSAGDNSRAPQNMIIPDTIRVRVVDAFGNGVPNITVNWAVTGGGGSVAAPTSLTNAAGYASAPAWTIGAIGTQLLTATSGALNAQFTASVQSAAVSITQEIAPPASAFAGLALPTAPRFAVRDVGGNILNSIPVTVSVSAGGGAIANAPTVSTSTPTSIGTWTLGNPLGAQTVTVAVDGIPSLVLTTTAIVGPAALIDVIEGEGQAAPAGATVGAPIRVRVRDVAMHPVPNTVVSFEVIAGGGSVAAVTANTDGSGVVTVPTWTLGRLGGGQTVRIVSGNGILNVNVVIQTSYGLEVRFTGTPPTGPVADAFTSAVNRIRAIVIGSTAPVNFASFNAGGCVAGLTINEAVTGLLIFATVEPIDGPSGVLGSAGPCFRRSSDTLAVVGRMRFDIADLETMITNGTLESVILHEMLHVIGVGTLWTAKGLKIGNAPTSTPFFTGNLARSACVNDHSGASVCGAAVPIEDCLNLTGSCGAGTINSHWKESTFRTELMTGFLSATGNPFSKMTIQSLADMGYTVNLNAQDPYTVPPSLLMSMIPAFTQKMPEPHGPLAEVDNSGRITKRFMMRLPPLDQ